LHPSACRAAVLALAFLLGTGAPARAGDDGARRRAIEVAERASARFATGNLDDRRAAIREMEDAARVASDEPRVLGPLADAYLDAGFSNAGRRTCERMVACDSSDARAWLGLARFWKRDWVATLAGRSLVESMRCLEHATRADPGSCPAWTALAALRFEVGNGAGADEACARARAADPADVRARLAEAYLAWRAGRAAEADRLFAAVLPDLPREVARRFDDLAPLMPIEAGERFAELLPADRAEVARRFWSASDPDPAAPWNTARLEFLARVAHATLLLHDPQNETWDARAEMYVRYGSPAAVAYQPPGVSLAQHPNRRSEFFQDPLNGLRFVGDASPMWYPMHVEILSYPALGMTVRLNDLSLSQRYDFPRFADWDGDPRPDSVAVARAGLLAAGGGRGVFPPLPPRTPPLELRARVSRFEGRDGGRLVAQVVAPGGPGERLVASCVVVDTSEHEVARVSETLSPSRCDAAGMRAGEFAFDLPPGGYRVSLAVEDRGRRRGIARAVVALPPAQTALGMSDLVPVCSTPDVASRREAVRLDPRLPARVASGEALQVYFEVYRLGTRDDGEARFDYTYAVHSLAPDRRPWYRRLFAFGAPPPRVTVRTSQESPGPTRRQYITVPTGDLGSGRYRLTVQVRDRTTGVEASRSVEFECAS